MKVGLKCMLHYCVYELNFQTNPFSPTILRAGVFPAGGARPNTHVCRVTHPTLPNKGFLACYIKPS